MDSSYKREQKVDTKQVHRLLRRKIATVSSKIINKFRFNKKYLNDVITASLRNRRHRIHNANLRLRKTTMARRRIHQSRKLVLRKTKNLRKRKQKKRKKLEKKRDARPSS